MTAAQMVFRIQDSEGRGPYRPGFSNCWTDPNGPDTPPWWVELGKPLEEALKGMSDPSMHYGCGFDSLAQMHSWFTARELRTLNRLDFRLIKFEPSLIVAHTPRQVVFGHRAPLATVSPRISLVSSLARAA